MGKIGMSIVDPVWSFYFPIRLSKKQNVLDIFNRTWSDDSTCRQRRRFYDHLGPCVRPT